MKHKVKHIHFVGIGGSGMSGIAEVLLGLGYQVSGSDVAHSTATQRLQEKGARVMIGHNPGHVAGSDVVVISTAIKHDNPEIAAARRDHIPLVPRALMLAELMRLKQGIAIAGTHGKTTTTSLVASVLAEAGEDPTFVIGGRLNSTGSHARLGRGDYLVVEADESDASFLHLQPVISVVTNIDVDHMETYNHDFAGLKRTFIEFLQRLPFYGAAVVCIDDAAVRDTIQLVSRRIITYGRSEQADIRADDIRHVAGRMRFTVERRAKLLRRGQKPRLDVELNLPGVHNVLNALAAIGVAQELGLADEAIVSALKSFQGVGRRLQRWGDVTIRAGCVASVIDDYGHHPAEMRVTLDAVRGAFPDRRLLLAFQPHRYSRTRDLFDNFVEVLSTADGLLLADVYPAGESYIQGADGKSLYQAVRRARRVAATYVENITDMAKAIRGAVQDGDVIVTMGAGSIGAVAPLLAGIKPGKPGRGSRTPSSVRSA
ncbi:MAG: UDP-N-acetylmuramate--L-alanine ligase [Betaproteobacteria bacterium]|nr:UDP-N-acetylmuramate--L-alanine ligase [Betaproteobacteria bacterium]